MGIKGSVKPYVLFLTAALFVAGLLSGWLGRGYFPGALEAEHGYDFKAERVFNPQYPYINPLIECEMGESLTIAPIRSFKAEVEELIDAKIADGAIINAAVYFRDLNEGPSFGIHEKTNFLPGSLLKVPTMMGFLKAAEDVPEILEEKIINNLNANEVPKQSILPSETIVKGGKYTVDELIQRMIVFSDNYATVLLNKNGGTGLLNHVGKAFGISIQEDGLSVKQYASFFRVLYNASFLNEKYSNYALAILNKSEFTSGIVAGVPERTAVANKFGERVTNDWAQLHDCGIVYHQDNPYLLCVMTKGKEMQKLPPVIAEISRVVFQNVDAQIKEIKSIERD